MNKIVLLFCCTHLFSKASERRNDERMLVVVAVLVYTGDVCLNAQAKGLLLHEKVCAASGTVSVQYLSFPGISILSFSTFSFFLQPHYFLP